MARNRTVPALRAALAGLCALACLPASPQRAAAGGFSRCGDAARVNCVVDGDTLWLDGVKIRLLDIDAPELSEPRCDAERVRAEKAAARLLRLVNSGTPAVERRGPDEDRYHRKLRMIRVNGRSVGEVLAQEGLARRWTKTPPKNGPGWCRS